MSTKVALVTGASSGIGAAAARKLHSLGYTVYGAARRVERMAELADNGVHVLSMDVTDAASMAAGIETVIAESGRIDVLVNNAGYGAHGAVEDVPMAQARAQFEVNVFGAAALTQLVLPHMRAQRSGTIINISSIGGKIYLPLGGWYHSTKYALEGLSDCLRVETRPFGINVVVIEPGSIRTEWGAIAAENLRGSSAGSAYSHQADAIAKQLARSSEPGTRLASDPSVIADTIARAVSARRPKTRYAVGAGAKPAILLRKVLSDRAFDAVLRLGINAASR